MMLFFSDFKKLLALALPAVLFTISGAALAQPPQVQNVNSVAFVSGGVGDESMAQLTDIEQKFDLKLLLVGQSGGYLSDVSIAITDTEGKAMLQTTSEGPVLLANLPTGAYTIRASKNGNRLTQIINVTLGQLRTIYLRFPGE